MLKEYDGFLDLNLVLEDKYNYKYEENLLETFCNQDFVELEGNGVTAMCWIKIDGEKYLFKPLEQFDINIWGELLSNKVAKKLGIECAEYRACSLGREKGVLTKSIVKNDENLLLGCEFFQDFFNEYPNKKSEIVSILEDDKFMSAYDIPKEFLDYDFYDRQRYLFNRLNNLEQVWSMLSDYKNISEEETYKITKFLGKMLLFDMITLQADRHVNNWGIIQNNEGYRVCPLFDNAVSFGLGYPNAQFRISGFKNEVMNYYHLKDDTKIKNYIETFVPRFTLSEDNVIDDTKKIKDKSTKVLDDYMRKSDQGDRDLARQFIDEINVDVIDEMINEVEIENGLNINDNVRFYIDSIMEFNLGYLNNVISKYNRSEVVNERNSSK